MQIRINKATAADYGMVVLDVQEIDDEIIIEVEVKGGDIDIMNRKALKRTPLDAREQDDLCDSTYDKFYELMFRKAITTNS
jgi:hypothetical protein